MEDDVARVFDLVARESPAPGPMSGSLAWLQCLCRAAVRAVPAAGAGISVILEGGTQGLAAASDVHSEWVEELQFTLGEGPCRDAHASGRPVLAEDLGANGLARWPTYSRAALDRGVGAVFAFPMRIGTARLGVLGLYRLRPGALTPAAFHLAGVFADAALTGLLGAHEAVGADRPPAGIDQGYRVEVYQAQGMVQVQLGVGPEEAIMRLRAHAHAQGRRLSAVARDVVARKLTLERDER